MSLTRNSALEEIEAAVRILMRHLKENGEQGTKAYQAALWIIQELKTPGHEEFARSSPSRR